MAHHRFSQKQTDEFVLFAFLIFTANKSNSSIRFAGESMVLFDFIWPLEASNYNRKMGQTFVTFSEYLNFMNTKNVVKFKVQIIWLLHQKKIQPIVGWNLVELDEQQCKNRSVQLDCIVFAKTNVCSVKYLLVFSLVSK